MKKKVILLIGGTALIATLGVGLYQADASKAETILPQEEIKQIVTSTYTGTITEFELEKEFNGSYYEVEMNDNGKEYDIKVDAETGEIVSFEESFNPNDDDLDDVQNSNSERTNVIDIDKAIEIALAKFNGEIKEIELDEDDGRYTYEIEIKNNSKKADIEIDAETGEIIEFEIDED